MGLVEWSQLWRNKRRYPLYSATLVATVAVTLGLTLIAYTAVGAVWLRRPAIPDPGQVVTIPTHIWSSMDAPVLRSFGDVAGQVVTEGTLSQAQPLVSLRASGRRLEVLGVTWRYFDVLRLAVQGRSFKETDDVLGSEPVAIVSASLWRTEFGSRPDLIGSIVDTEQLSIRIIGIAPEGFRGARRGERTEIWIPASLVPRLAKGGDVSPTDLAFHAIARLRPGQTPVALERAIRDDSREYAAAYSNLTVVPIDRVFGTPTSPTLIIADTKNAWVVGLVTLLLMLGSCGSVTVLSLLHYEGRREEFAVRLAMGATRSQLSRQLFSELSSVGVVGCAGALALTAGGLRMLGTLELPGGVTLDRLDLTLDWRLCIAAVLGTALTLMLSASWSVRRIRALEMAVGSVAGLRARAFSTPQRIGRRLLALQTCAVVVIAITAALFVRSATSSYRAAPGFDIDHTVFVKVQVLSASHRLPDRVTRLEMLTQDIRSALAGTPGVLGVADGTAPLGRDASDTFIHPSVLIVNGERQILPFGHWYVGPKALSTSGIAIRSGRDLGDSDRGVNPIPAVITESMAAKLWPGEDPLGQVVRTNMFGGARQIVGVAGDFAFGSLQAPVREVFVTFGPSPEIMVPRFVVRTNGDRRVSGLIRRTVESAAPNGTGLEVVTGRELVTRDIGAQLIGAWFFSGFGLIGLMLGTGATFGLSSLLVGARRREVSVRLALGATHSGLFRSVIGSVMSPVFVGTVFGVALAASGARIVGSHLVGLSPFDLIAYSGTVATVVGASAVAGVLGAWRLTKVTAGEALREV